MRFIQLGDLHLGPGPRNDDRLAALDSVIEAGLRHRDLAAWFFPGDLNHAKMTIEDRNALVERMIRMANAAPVVVVPGNHDAAGDLDFLAYLETSYPIYVVTKPDMIDVRPPPLLTRSFSATFETFKIFCLPYPTKANLVAAGIPHGDMGEQAALALDAIFMQAAAQFDEARQNGQLVMALGHANIAGSVASTGQPQIGHELEVTRAHLSRLGDCFIGFNHIHKHQQIGPAWYAGSLCRLDWGEIEPKGYLEIECATLDASTFNRKHVTWTHAVTFRPIDVPPMYHVEGMLTRDGFDWQVVRGPGDGGMLFGRLETWTGCDVRVRVRYAQPERDLLNDGLARVRDEFKTARRVEIEPMAVIARELRAPEVVHAQTLDAKLRAFAKLTCVKWSDVIEQCATELLASDDGETVIHMVEQRLAGVVMEE